MKNERWFNNAAIMGLVNTNKISLQDLISCNNENSAREENETLVMYNIIIMSCITLCYTFDTFDNVFKDHCPNVRKNTFHSMELHLMSV